MSVFTALSTRPVAFQCPPWVPERLPLTQEFAAQAVCLTARREFERDAKRAPTTFLVGTGPSVKARGTHTGVRVTHGSLPSIAPPGPESYHGHPWISVLHRVARRACVLRCCPGCCWAEFRQPADKRSHNRSW